MPRRCSTATARRSARDRRQLLESYRYVHVARKVVGVGSVGTRAWIVLFVGRDDGDPLFLQVKEAQASVLEPYAGASEFEHHGQRVVEGQRLMQAASDIFLGWCAATGRRRRARLLRAPALGRQGLGRGRGDAARRARRLRAASAAGPCPGPRPLRRPRGDRRLPRRAATSSTGRSPSSPPPTRTRTSATTPRWRRRSTPAASRPRDA